EVDSIHPAGPGGDPILGIPYSKPGGDRCGHSTTHWSPPSRNHHPTDVPGSGLLQQAKAAGQVVCGVKRMRVQADEKFATSLLHCQVEGERLEPLGVGKQPDAWISCCDL